MLTWDGKTKTRFVRNNRLLYVSGITEDLYLSLLAAHLVVWFGSVVIIAALKFFKLK